MMNRNTLDPLQAARDFTRHPHPRRQFLGLAQRVAAVERRASRLAHEGGSGGEAAAAVAQVDGTPEITEDDVGTFFLSRNGNADDVLNVAIAAKDGTPILVGLNTYALTGGIEFLWEEKITGLADLTAVAADASGNVYIGRNTLSTGGLQKYNSSLVQQWSQDITQIVAAATDGTNVFLSTPAVNAVTKRLASTGAAGSPATFGSAGSGDGQFNLPWGIVTDGTHVWVVDRSNDRVQKFTVAGVYVSQFGGFSDPTGIALTATHIYVLDPGAAEIRKYLKSDHSLVSTFALGEGNAEGQITNSAEGIAVDSHGHIWIADTGAHRIQVFASDGSFLARFGLFGSGDQQLKSPRQIAVDAADRVWMADSGNSRIVTVREDLGITPAVTVRTNTVVISGSGNNDGETTAACAAGEVVTGGGCSNETNDSVNFVVTDSAPSGQGWRCRWRNANTGTTITGKAHAVCMAVPLTEG